MTQYQFIISSATGTRQVYPSELNKCKLVYELVSEDSIIYRRKFKGALVFTGADYSYLYEIELAQSCEEITLTIHKTCNGTTSLLWTGMFSTGSGKFNLDKCTFSVTPEVVDEYSCYLKDAKKEVNTLTVTKTGGNLIFYAPETGTYTHEVMTINRRLDTNGNLIQCTATLNGSPITCPADYVGWCNISDTIYHLPNAIRVYSVWTREVVTVPDVAGVCVAPDSSWTLLSHIGSDCKYYRCGDGVSKEFKSRKLNDIVEGMMNNIQSECPLGVTSIFFNINPDTDDIFYSLTSSGDLNYVTGQDSMTKDLMWAHKSDVKYPNATNPATMGYVTIEKMLQYLEFMFNVRFSIEGSTMKIEHISYYESGQSIIDLTGYVQEQSGKNEYSHYSDEIPSSEVFTFMENIPDGFTAGQIQFKGYPIVYSSPCATREAKKYEVDKITTDLQKIITFTPDFPDMFSSEGFVVIATKYDSVNAKYIINHEKLYGGTQSHLNGHLSWVNLHQNYHRHGRYLPSGNMNNTASVQFISYRENIAQMPIDLLDCCETPEISPSNRYITVLGSKFPINKLAAIKTLEFDFETGFWRIVFKYKK